MRGKFRKSLAVLLILALTIVLFAACGQSSTETTEGDAEGSQTFDLKLSHSMAVTSYSQKAYEYFAEALEEESEGTIKVTVYPGSTLVSDAESFDAVLSGNVEIAQFQASYLSSFMPEFMILEIPGIYSGAVFPLLHEATKDIMNEIFASYGVKYVAPIPHDVLVFVGDSLVTDPANQLEGKKIRVAGKWNGEAVKEWGGSPMTINIGDVPAALERKTVNLVNTSWIATNGFKLYESGPNVTFTNMQEIFPGLILNQEIWNSFSDEQKAAFDRATERFVEYGYELMLNEKEAFIKTCEEADVAMHTATDEENAFYRAAAEKLIEKIKPDTTELGLKLIEAIQDPKLQ